MVAPYAERDIELTLTTALAAAPFVDITVAMMRSFGVALERDGYQRFLVPACQRYQALDYQIEPDASNASYFCAAAALTGGRVRIAGLARASIQGDIRFLTCSSSWAAWWSPALIGSRCAARRHCAASSWI